MLAQSGKRCQALNWYAIRQDATIPGATLLDITPTVLMLFGLPVGGDMEGKVLVNAFEQPPGIERIDSWENVSDAFYDARVRDGVRQRPCGPGHRDTGPGLRAAHQRDERGCHQQPHLPAWPLRRPCRVGRCRRHRHARPGRAGAGLPNPLLALVPLHDAGLGIARPYADLLRSVDSKADASSAGRTVLYK
jgi:hypothetical protein